MGFFSRRRKLRQPASEPPAEEVEMEITISVESEVIPSDHVKEPRWYVESGKEPDRFLDQEGLPTLRLRPYTSGETVLRLMDTKTGLLVGPTDRRLVPAGILSVQVRGEYYHAEGCEAGDYSLSAAMTLIPEPDNKYDPHAVKVCDAEGANLCGYVNKQKARVYARMVEQYGPLRAVSVRGTASGDPAEAIGFVAATSDVIDLLLSDWPRDAPPPRF